MQHRELRAHRCSGTINGTSLRVRSQHRYRRTTRSKVHAVEHWQTSCEMPEKLQSKLRKNIVRARRSPLLDLPEWLEEFTENFVDEEGSASSGAPASILREPLHYELSIKVVSGASVAFLHTRALVIKYFERKVLVT